MIALKSLVLSTSLDCGIWTAPEADSRLHDRDFEYAVESRARLYGTLCYGKPVGTDGCNLYYNQSLSFVEKMVPCPFTDGVCASLGNSTLEFDTGFFDSKTLGINIFRSHHLRRRSICSPVVSDEKYVRLRKNIYGKGVAEYYFGNMMPDGQSWNGIDSNFTFNSSMMFTRDNPSYRLTSFRSKAPGPQAYILPEFRVLNHSITLMIIEQSQIFYLGKRDDPIFPADKQTTRPDFNRKLWYDGRNHGSVLICADTWEICKHDNSECWNRDNAPPAYKENTTNPADGDLAYYLLWQGFLPSNTFNSIKQSHTYVLDAQRHIDQLLITEFAEEQWKVEARLHFQSSMARLQQEIYEIQRGTAKNQPGFINKLPDN